MSSSEKDVNHTRKHSSILFHPADIHWVPSILVIVQLLRIQLLWSSHSEREGWQQTQKWEESITSVIRATKSNHRDDVVENYWADSGNCFRYGCQCQGSFLEGRTFDLKSNCKKELNWWWSEGREVHVQDTASVKARSERKLGVLKECQEKAGKVSMAGRPWASETGVRARSCAAL